MPQQFRLTGLKSFVDRHLRRLATAPLQEELREIHHTLSTSSRRIEISLSTKHLEAAQLTATTRALRGWLAFMSDWDDLAGYVQAIRTGAPLIEAAVRQQNRWKPPVWIYLRPMRGVYQLRQRRDGVELSLPTPAVCFTPDDFGALAPYIFGRNPAAKKHILHRMQSEEFQAITAELEVLGGAVDVAAGKAYDLNALFDQINLGYFQGQVKRPKLYWSRAFTRRKFGHYDWVGDAIMISRTLDHVNVPPFVVEFVMYHEMLHKVLGLRWSGGRQYAHTAEFYRQEKRFARHSEAETVMKKLAAGKFP